MTDNFLSDSENDLSSQEKSEEEDTPKNDIMKERGSLF
jgi:hypothetical protein